MQLVPQPSLWPGCVTAAIIRLRTTIWFFRGYTKCLPWGRYLLVWFVTVAFCVIMAKVSTGFFRRSCRGVLSQKQYYNNYLPSIDSRRLFLFPKKLIILTHFIEHYTILENCKRKLVEKLYRKSFLYLYQKRNIRSLIYDSACFCRF